MQKHAEIKDVFAEAQLAKTETNTWNIDEYFIGWKNSQNDSSREHKLLNPL